MAEHEMPSGRWRQVGRLASRGAAGAAVLVGAWGLVRARTATVIAQSRYRRRGEPGSTARGKRSFTPDSQSLAAHYEKKDLSGRDLGLIMATLAAGAGVLIGICFGLIALFGHFNHAARLPLTLQQAARIVPPAPRLQIHPFADLTRLHEHETRLLHSYAWVDPAHQRARIPIRRAMQLTIGRSLDASP